MLLLSRARCHSPCLSDSPVESVSLGASLDVAVVVEDGEEMEANVEDVAVGCDLSCNIDEYRVDEEVIVDESGVIKRKRCKLM